MEDINDWQSCYILKKKKKTKTKTTKVENEFDNKIFSKVWQPIEEDIKNIMEQHHNINFESIWEAIEDLEFHSINSNRLNLFVLTHNNMQGDSYIGYDILIKQLNTKKEKDIFIADIPCLKNETSLDSVMKKCCLTWSKNRFGNKINIKDLPTDLFSFSNFYLKQDKKDKQDLFIVLLRDYSVMDMTQFNDYLTILNIYSTKLPLLVILGNTGLEIQLDMQHKIWNQLNLNYFKFTLNKECFENIVYKYFIIGKRGVLLSSNVFNWLLNLFNNTDQSISSFLRILKYIHMTYFFQEPNNPFYLTSLKEVEVLSQNYNSIPISLLNKLRCLKSFKEYCNNNNDQQHIKKLILEDEYLFYQLIIPALKNIINYKVNLSIAISILKLLFQYFKIEKSIVIIYKDILYSNAVNCNWFNTLLFKVKSFLSLKLNNDSNWLSLVENIEYEVSEYDFKNEEKDTFDFIIESAKKYNVKPFVNWILQFLRDNLKSPSNLIFYEWFYFDQISILQKTFFASPSTTLSLSLNYTKLYNVKNKPTLPSDMTICFKLFLQAGNLINLKDWYNTYKHILKLEYNKLDPNKIWDEKQIIARFSHCLNELKFLGYLKHSNLKTDHVLKLIW